MSKKGCRIPLSRLGCYAMVEEEGKAWFVRSQANGLYKFDKKENRAKLLMRFEDFAIDKDFLYLGIEKVGNVLVLAPASASKIVFYDLETDKAEYVELMPIVNRRKVKYKGGVKFLKCYRHGGNIYLFGFEYPAILKIDVNTKQIVYFMDWVQEVERRIKKKFVTMGYVSDYVVVGECVWALCECANAVLCLDLRTDEIKVVDIGSDLDVHCGICFDGNFWVTGYNENANKLLKYNCSFVLEKEVKICLEKRDGNMYSFSSQDNLWISYPMIDIEEHLLLFSVYPRHVYEFDKVSCEVRILPAFEEILEVHDERFHYMGILAPRKKGNFVCFITGNDFLWNEYDFVHDTLIRYEVVAEADEEFLQEKSKIMNGRIFRENVAPWNLGYELTLSRFVEHVAYVSETEVDDMGKDNRVSKIHEKNDRGALVR